MISRIFIPIILAIVLPDLYFDTHYLNRRIRMTWWKRLIWWLPSILMIFYTISLASLRNFVPDDLRWMNVYLMILGLFIFPKALFALCSSLGLIYCKISHRRTNWGNIMGLILGSLSIYILIYGFTIGFRKLDVMHEDLYFRDLPATFDGYRMTVFSDAHVGTLTSKSDRQQLQRTMDSINAQRSDIILFLGDIQNIQPSELYPVQSTLSSLHAKDGVFSVLGNHDYSFYIDSKPSIKIANDKETISREKQFGWKLLLNEHQILRRGKDSLVIAGEENQSFKKTHRKGNLKKTLNGIAPNAFVVLLQHDPSAWRKEILPNSHAQLTLSGHTHGGQFSVLGWRSTTHFCPEDYGLYLAHNRALYVSAGIGGLLRFRFGLSAQITVITLHRLK